MARKGRRVGLWALSKDHTRDAIFADHRPSSPITDTVAQSDRVNGRTRFASKPSCNYSVILALVAPSWWGKYPQFSPHRPGMRTFQLTQQRRS